MRKDTTFSDKKLTLEEFSQKYWMEGEAPYQYHTATIEDGRDEREQFLFNNCRSLWEHSNRIYARAREMSGNNERLIKKVEKKMAKLIFCSVAINIAIIVLILFC